MQAVGVMDGPGGAPAVSADQSAAVVSVNADMAAFGMAVLVGRVPSRCAREGTGAR